jgi:hypothetical protein
MNFQDRGNNEFCGDAPRSSEIAGRCKIQRCSGDCLAKRTQNTLDETVAQLLIAEERFHPPTTNFSIFIEKLHCDAFLM